MRMPHAILIVILAITLTVPTTVAAFTGLHCPAMTPGANTTPAIAQQNGYAQVAADCGCDIECAVSCAAIPLPTGSHAATRTATQAGCRAAHAPETLPAHRTDRIRPPSLPHV